MPGRVLAVLTAAVAAAVAGVVLLRPAALPARTTTAPAGPPASAPAWRPAGAAAPDRSGAAGYRSPRRVQTVADPLALRIPRIGVASRLQRLGLAGDGTLQAPTRWDTPGWYAQGARPGELGSSVLLGHVDSTTGPAVFFRLRELRRGDLVVVDRADGTAARFVVDRVATYPKSAFPTAEVYYPTLSPGLRLVTCGGTFDRRAGHYRSNVIVFATAR